VSLFGSLARVFASESKIKYALLVAHYFIHLIIGKDIDPTFLPERPEADKLTTNRTIVREAKELARLEILNRKLKP
jgi:hypothetical protein